MKNTFKVILTLIIPVMFFISCEDNTLPLEPISNTNENNSLSKMKGPEAEQFSNHRTSKFIEQALKFIEQAQDKINKAEDKFDKAVEKAVEKAGEVTPDLVLVDEKIDEAIAELALAKTYYDPDGNYAEAINSAKLAKELAGEALDMLEDILDDLDDDGDGENDSAKQALKFIEQAQDKINKAEDKFDKAVEKAGEVTPDLVLVDEKIDEAIAELALAKTYYDPDGNYAEAINSAKLAKELAGEALDMLEDILDDLDDDGDGENDSAKQALKFIEQAQDKINKAEDKFDKAVEKAGEVTPDLVLVDEKIDEAIAELALAKTYYDPDGNYAEAISSAKLAKELASEALDMLEDILDDLDDD